jgi:TP901 family phage tail tape measure protein
MPNLNIAILIDSKQAEAETKRLEGMFRSMVDTFQKSRKAFGLGDDTIKEVQQATGLFDAYGKEMKKVADIAGKELAPATEKVRTSTKGLYGDVLNLRGGIKGFINDMEMMIRVQMRWYAARTLISMSVEMVKGTIKSGIEYTKVLDEANAKLLRWGATSGQVTDTMRADVKDLVMEIRKDILTIPVDFQKAFDAVEFFVGAGVPVKTVQAMTPDILKLINAFPEIDMKQFSVAITGFVNTFGDAITEADTFEGKFKVILEQMIRASAVSIIRPEEFTKVIQYMGEVGKLAGFSTAEILALATAISDTGVQSSRASRLVSSLWAAFTQPKAIAALHSIGIEIDKSKTLAQQFIPIMDQLRKKLGIEGGAATFGAMTFLAGFTSKDQLRIMLAVMDVLDKYEKRIGDIKGATGGMAAANEVASQSISKQWELLKSVFTELSADVSVSRGTLADIIQCLLGIANTLLGVIAPLEIVGDRLNNLSGPAKLITTLLIGLITGFKLLYDLFASGLNNIIEQTSGAFIALGKALGGLGAFLTGEISAKELWDFLKTDVWAGLMKSQDKAYQYLKTGWGNIINDASDANKRLSAIWLNEPLSSKKALVGAGGTPGGGKPGLPPDIPDAQKVKDYHNQIINAVKQYYHALLDIEKAEGSLSLSILEDQYRMGLVAIEDYYEQRQKIMEASTTKERELLAIEAQEITDTYLKAVENTKITVKPENLTAALKALRLQYDATITGIQAKDIAFMNKSIQDQIKGLVDMTMRVRQIFQNDLQSRSRIEQDILQQRSDAIKDSYQEEETLTKWLYDQKLIGATDYFNKLNELNDKGLKADLERLDNEYTAFLLEKGAEIDFLYSQGVVDVEEYDKRNREINERYQKWFGDREKTIRDHTSKEVQLFRDASINIQKIYEDQGAMGVISKAMDDTEKEWKETWNYLYKETKEVYEGLSQSFSDIFYDGITGKLKSLKDYFESIFNSILRYFTDMLGRMAAQNLQQLIMGKATWMTSAGTELFNVGMAGGMTQQQAMAGGATPSYGGGMLGGGIGSLLGYGGLGAGIGMLTGGSSLGGGLGGMLGGFFADATIGALGMSSTFIGSALSAGASALGMSIGSFVPIVGTVLGGLLGSLIGGLFDSESPDFGEMAGGYIPNAGQAPGIGQTGEWRHYTTPEGYRFSVNMSDEGWPMTDAELQSFATAFDTISTSVKDVMDEFGLDISGFSKQWAEQIDLEGLDAEAATAKIREWMASYVEFASNIDFSQWQKSGEDLIDTIDRILIAMSAFPETLESIGRVIDVISGDMDAAALFLDDLATAMSNIEELDKALAETTDPSDAIAYATQIKEAVWNAFSAAETAINNLVDSIAALETEAVYFPINMQTKIDELTGSSQAIGMMWDRMTDLFNQIVGSEWKQKTGIPETIYPIEPVAPPVETLTATERLTALNEYLGLLDQWVTANTTAIENFYSIQKEAIDNQISAIQTEIDLTQNWTDVLDSVNQQILDMKTSSASQLDIFERMDIMRTEIESMQGLYTGATGEEKAGYASDLQSLISDYLSQAQEAYQRPSPEYQAISNEMLGWLEGIKTDAQTYSVSETDLLAQIADLQSQQATLDTQMADDIQAFKDEAAGYYQWAMDEGAKLYADQISELEQTLQDVVGDKSVGEYIEDLRDSAVLELQRVQNLLAGIFANQFPGMTIPSYQSGLDYVPYDNYTARLHSGERVLTADENRRYSSTQTVTIAPQITIHAEGKAGYASQLQSLISEYLGMAQEAYQRPSPEYQAISSEMLGWLEGIKTDAGQYAQSEIDLLKQISDLTAQSTAIDEQILAYQAQIKDLPEQQDAQNKAIDELEGQLQAIIGNGTVEQFIAQLKGETIAELQKIENTLGSILYAFTNIPQSAGGNYFTRPSLTWVGEKGPEYIIPQSKMGAGQNVIINMALPPITINAGDKASPYEIARATEDVVIKSIKGGRVRKAIQEAVAGR